MISEAEIGGGWKRKSRCLQHTQLVQKKKQSPPQALSTLHSPPQHSQLSSVHQLQLIPLALRQSTVEPLLGRKPSEVEPSPLRQEADLQRWCWPGLPSFSKSSSQLDTWPPPRLSQFFAGSAGLLAASQGSTACSGGAGGHSKNNTPCHPGRAGWFIFAA